MAKVKKFKLKIDCDGTVAGTKVMVNGEEVTKSKNVTNVSFYASGGVKWRDDDKLNPYVDFGYRVLNKNDDGSETGENYSYSPENGIERGAIGKPKEKMNDSLVGKESEIIEKILSYKGKTKRFIPDKEELRARSSSSLQDLAADLARD